MEKKKKKDSAHGNIPGIQTFEEDLSALEAVVNQLEEGEVSLDEMLHLYEKGIRLSRSCGKVLEDVEQYVFILKSDVKTPEQVTKAVQETDHSESDLFDSFK